MPSAPGGRLGAAVPSLYVGLGCRLVAQFGLRMRPVKPEILRYA
jgi:hypothetical protein